MSNHTRKPRRVSESYIKELTWDGKDRREALGDGLYIHVRRSSKTYLYRRRDGGRETFETLGHHPGMPYRDAKAEAAIRARQADLSTATIGDLLTKYEAQITARQRQPKQAMGYLKRIFTGAWLTRRAREVRRAELVKLVQDYRLAVPKKTKGRRGEGYRAADQLRSVLTAFFGHALELGAVDTNPMTGVSSAISGYVYAPRTRVLTDDEIRRIWALDDVHARILRFLLLTGLRIRESRVGHREGDRWVVPATVSKTGKKVGRDHWVHLTPTAAALLPLPSRSNEATQHWVQAWCKAQDILPPFTPHDTRRTCVTRLNALGFEPWLVERWVGHTLQGMMRVYNQHDYPEKRRAASEALEAHMLAVANATMAPAIVDSGAPSVGG